MMKIFIAEFTGHYVGGEMLIVDETKRKAFNKAKREIGTMGLESKNKEFSIDDLKEIDYSKKQCVVIDNGDY